MYTWRINCENVDYWRRPYMKQKCLINALLLEDNGRFATQLHQSLGKLNIMSTIITDPASAINVLNTLKNKYQMIFLDYGFSNSKLTGLDVLKFIHDSPYPSINSIISIMITANENPDILKKAFELNVREFMKKPVMQVELTSRLKSCLRAHFAQSFPILKNGLLKVHLTTRTFYIGDKEVHLTPSQFAMIIEFIRYKGQPISKMQLRQVISMRVEMNGASLKGIDVQIFNLRRTLAKYTNLEFIVTRWGEGYTMINYEDNTAVYESIDPSFSSPNEKIFMEEDEEIDEVGKDV